MARHHSKSPEWYARVEHCAADSSTESIARLSEEQRARMMDLQRLEGLTYNKARYRVYTPEQREAFMVMTAAGKLRRLQNDSVAEKTKTSAYSARWRERNPDYQPTWHKRNPVATRDSVRRGMALRFSRLAPPPEAECPPRPPDGLCQCCGRPQTRRTRAGVIHKLALDHDGWTGKFRGWICHRCNRAIGMLGDLPGGIRMALEYLERVYRDEPEPWDQG